MHLFMALASTIDFFSRSILIFRGRFPLTLNHFFPIFVWLPSVCANGFLKGTLLTLGMQVAFQHRGVRFFFTHLSGHCELLAASPQVILKVTSFGCSD
jgi:hypothetical protein